VDKAKHKGVEKRKFQRLEIPLNVTLKIITEEEALNRISPLMLKSRDISKDGISLETLDIVVDNINILSGSPGARENLLDMAIELTEGEVPIKAIGEVCWYDLARDSEEFMYQVGVVFIKIDEKDKEQLEIFLKKHKKNKDFLSKIFSSFK
jgi:c-di-GMP-binding flagellar brake protein YcgR